MLIVLVWFCFTMQVGDTYLELGHKKKTCSVEQIMFNIYVTRTKNLTLKENGRTDFQNFRVSTPQMCSSYELQRQKVMHFFVDPLPCHLSLYLRTAVQL